MKDTQNLAYLLIYAAHIDLDLQQSEKDYLSTIVNDQKTLKNTLEAYKTDTEYQRLQKVNAILSAINSNQKSTIFTQLRGLMESDTNFSVIERALLKLMEKNANE